MARKLFCIWSKAGAEKPRDHGNRATTCPREQLLYCKSDISSYWRQTLEAHKSVS